MPDLNVETLEVKDYIIHLNEDELSELRRALCHTTLCKKLFALVDDEFQKIWSPL